MMRALLHWLRWRVPDHPFLYTLAQRYVMQYLGEDTEDMLLNGEWLCIRHFIPTARTVFDVGANVGEWASLVRKVNPECEIHCFEPSPSTFEQLCKACLPGKVVLNNFGLSSKPGTANLHTFSETIHNSLHPVRYDHPETGLIQIELKTMDGYISDKGIELIDYCKIDVEGHELEVLLGMSRTIREE